MVKMKLTRDKTVFVTIYVEKNQRRINTSTQHNHIHNLHVDDDNKNKGYDRKAELLRYSQHLRDSASSTKSEHSPSRSLPLPLPQPKLVSNSYNNINQHSKYQITSVDKKTKHVDTPACCSFGCVTGFQAQNRNKKQKRTVSSVELKMKFLMKSMDVQKKKGIISKMFAKLQKHK
ncbi:hypothetical protein ACFE04_027133 [Oxalis oulophora]